MKTTGDRELIRSVWTADGKRLELWTDGLVYNQIASINRVALIGEARWVFVELVSLFNADESDALIRRIAKAAKRLGPAATHQEIVAEEKRLENPSPKATKPHPFRDPRIWINGVLTAICVDSDGRIRSVCS